MFSYQLAYVEIDAVRRRNENHSGRFIQCSAYWKFLVSCFFFFFTTMCSTLCLRTTHVDVGRERDHELRHAWRNACSCNMYKHR